MKRPILAACAFAIAAASIAALPDASAGWRNPWEKPDDERERREPHPTSRAPYGYPPPRAEHRPAHHDAYAATLDRLHRASAEEVALARHARAHAWDPATRAYADRVLAEVGAFRHSLERRAAELRIGLSPVRVDLPRHRFEWRDDLAYLRRSMDLVASIRPEFNDFKAREADRHFRQALTRHWHDLVYRRDDAKSLHDEIRNRERARERGRHW